MRHPAERVVYHPEPTRHIMVRRVAFADVIGRGALDLSHTMQEIGRQSWSTSAWLLEATSDNRAAVAVANTVFETQNDGINRRRSALRRSLVGPDTYYLAAEKRVLTGWARLRNDVSGTIAERAFKRIRNTHLYAAIGDVCVRPAYQAHGTGVALVYTGLQDMNPEHRVTTYTASKNEELISMLERHGGFTVTGTQARPDLYGDIAIEEARLLGPPNGELQERLKNMYGWLARADVLHAEIK